MSIEDPLPGLDLQFAAEPDDVPMFGLLVDDEDDESPRYMVVDESGGSGAWLTAEATLSLGEWR